MAEVSAADALRVLGAKTSLQNFQSAGREAPVPLSASVPASALLSAPDQKCAGERERDVTRFLGKPCIREVRRLCRVLAPGNKVMQVDNDCDKDV